MGARATVDTHFGRTETSLAGIKGDSFQTEWLNKQRAPVCLSASPFFAAAPLPPPGQGKNPWQGLGGPRCAQDQRGALHTPSPCTPTTCGLVGVTAVLLRTHEKPRGCGDSPEVTQPRKPGARELALCSQSTSPGLPRESKQYQPQHVAAGKQRPRWGT